jgi:hypothetical protein
MSAIANQRGRHRETAKRHAEEYEREYGEPKPRVPFFRVAELERLALDRYQRRFPDCIPDTTDGLKLIAAIADHLVLQGRNVDPTKRVIGWCKARVRWMSDDQAQVVAERALNPDRRLNPSRTANQRLKMADADALAQYVGLDMATRTRLKIKTIGARDCPRDEREALRKVKQRDLTIKRRRVKGVVPRAEYEANSLSRLKPWEKEGISRPTWYRRQKEIARQLCQPLRERYGLPI